MLLPETEQALTNGVEKAVALLAAGGTRDDANRVLMVALTYAEFVESGRENLE